MTESGRDRSPIAVCAAAMCCAAALAGCAKDSPTQPSQPAAPTVSAPLIDSPTDDQQLTTVQPTLRVSNASSTPAGIRTYEFQVSSDDGFTAIAAAGQNVAEGSDGKTNWTVASALQPTTRYWWRARAVQSDTVGPWSTAARFRSRVQGYNRAGETDNRFRATVEKRFSGEVSFRFITGDALNPVNADRAFLTFDPSLTYFWRLTWGNGRVRMQIAENDANGRVLFDQTKGYSGTYQPNPHFAYVGAPVPRGGVDGASLPGMVVSDVWLSGNPRPAGSARH